MNKNQVWSLPFWTWVFFHIQISAHNVAPVPWSSPLALELSHVNEHSVQNVGISIFETFLQNCWTGCFSRSALMSNPITGKMLPTQKRIGTLSKVENYHGPKSSLSVFSPTFYLTLNKHLKVISLEIQMIALLANLWPECFFIASSSEVLLQYPWFPHSVAVIH